LRHCLIEHIQQNEIYVTNDLTLGADEKGILLFGTNAVGKTSLIRALCVSIIMAQSGMFVPSSKFVYKPYTAIFSRILGNDNLFKGLSTFAVEMTELRIILKMADENSLILGDELCSGTETESALSIFVAGLMKLSEKGSSHIFATHFHEIVTYSEIEALAKLSMKHMSVTYDRENDCLVYDRKLKDGSGPKIYGLEVCKSLYLEQEFLDLAYSIRNKYYPDSRGDLSSPTTIYNANKIRGKCEMCGLKLGEETHHLSPQQNADVNGFIGSFHKNHRANLASVCEECHDKLHGSNEKTASRKKTTRGYKVS
jgi:DNA mismatch repair protein MutS